MPDEKLADETANKAPQARIREPSPCPAHFATRYNVILHVSSRSRLRWRCPFCIRERMTGLDRFNDMVLGCKNPIHYDLCRPLAVWLNGWEADWLAGCGCWVKYAGMQPALEEPAAGTAPSRSTSSLGTCVHRDFLQFCDVHHPLRLVDELDVNVNVNVVYDLPLPVPQSQPSPAAPVHPCLCSGSALSVACRHGARQPGRPAPEPRVSRCDAREGGSVWLSSSLAARRIKPDGLCCGITSHIHREDEDGAGIFG